jgi:hypothetical protein
MIDLTRAEMNEGWARATTKLERGSLEWRAVHYMRKLIRELEKAAAEKAANDG